MNVTILNTQQLSQALKLHRKRRGWSQSDLATRSGLLPKTISALENQPGNCRIETLIRALAALGLNLSFLNPRRDSPPAPEVDW